MMQRQDEKDTQKIRIWNRIESRFEIEKIYGEKQMRFLYENPLGSIIANHFMSKSLMSQIMGLYHDSKLSALKVDQFIKKYVINIDEFESKKYSSFNDFFIRKFKSGKRIFADGDLFPAFCEGRYLGASETKSNQRFKIKDAMISVGELLGSQDSTLFEGGPLLIARLCPVDYHRFHFPDEGHILSHARISGSLHSVSPVALKFDPEIFLKNEREITLLETKTFGKLAYIEVGAMGVGKIVQANSMESGSEFQRGGEKGYFLFGGSTVIMIGEPGRWKPSNDILSQTKNKRETFIKLGDVIGGA